MLLVGSNPFAILGRSFAMAGAAATSRTTPLSLERATALVQRGDLLAIAVARWGLA